MTLLRLETSRVAALLMHLQPKLAKARNLPVVGDLLHHLSHALMPAGTRIWVQVRHGPAKGLWMNLNLRTGRETYLGEREQPVQRAIERHLQSGMTFYDVGANIGFFTLLAARLVGTRGRVVGFEPDPLVHERLRQNVTRNGFTNVDLVRAAAYSSSGTMGFIQADPACSPDLGLGRISPSEPGASITRVHTIALDDFVQRHSAPDFIKCDVEGAEDAVLQGARTLFETRRPIFICETHTRPLAESVSRTLVTKGYKIEWLGHWRSDGLDERNHLLALP